MKLDFSHRGIVLALAGVIGVAMSIFHLYVIVYGPPEAVIFRGLHLGFAIALIFLLYRFSGSTDGTPGPIDYLLLVLALAPIAYLFINYEYLVTRIYYIDDLTTWDIVWATAMIVLVLEATRRVIGWPLPLTAVIFLGYSLLIAKIPPMQLLDQLFMTTEGIFGIPLSVSASYVVAFVLFGSFMERTGTGQLFMDFAMALTGHSAGGPGKVSVVSSSLFGTISGSAVANVMVDGPISIPLMKRTGFRPAFAAGVEAVASTGGQIMPPIMGAAAFVMAEFLQVGYGQVIIWALIPSILYYVACFCAVHFEAKRNGILGVPRDELPRLSTTLRERGHLFIPVLTILAVMYSGYSAPMAAFWGTMMCFPVAALRASTRVNVTLWNVIDALIDGAKNALAVALACACAGIIIGIVTQTGVGLIFTQAVVGLAKETLLLALLLTAVAGIVLGMGMPTTPAYIIMTSLLVPAVIKLGVATPAAHMFAFYFAILSAITPPVALAVFAAAGLAKADLWSAGWAAVKIGASGFVVPFMFVYEPALLMLDPSITKSKDLVTAAWPAIAWATFTATVGITFLAAGLHGYLAARATMIERAILIVACFFLVNPNALAVFYGNQATAWLTALTDGIGLGLGAIVLLIHLARRRSTAEAPAQPAS
ncbi:MAG: TRAP transporter permease [Hyphomicrobiaceae bacterium]|nr:TRAP transporter permease [Hyphomicrobiaceae bacterium]